MVHEKRIIQNLYVISFSSDASGKNPASHPWAFSVPAVVTFVAVAKFIL